MGRGNSKIVSDEDAPLLRRAVQEAEATAQSLQDGALAARKESENQFGSDALLSSSYRVQGLKAQVDKLEQFLLHAKNDGNGSFTYTTKELSKSLRKKEIEIVLSGEAGSAGALEATIRSYGAHLGLTVS